MYDRRVVQDEVRASHARLTSALSSLTETQTRGPSALDGWSRGHVVHHIARNADSYWRLLEWARTGVERLQYPSAEARAAEIETGSDLPVSVLVADSASAAARFDEQARTLPEPAWEAMVRSVSGWPHPAWYTLYRRWREVEIHLVDLDVGYTPDDWPLPYVSWELSETLGAFAAQGSLPVRTVTATDLGRTFELSSSGPDLALPARPLLAYLSGRGPAPSAAPAAPSWPTAPAVDWSVR
ncbi:maleylpyruvate isomerase family mycothiol-dependent enzyme [Actinocorallia lasiicapitis]